MEFTRGAALVGAALFASSAASAADVPGNSSSKTTIIVDSTLLSQRKFGHTVTGVLERSGDSDWYRIKVVENGGYVVTGGSDEGNTIALHARTAGGKAIAAGLCNGRSCILHFTAPYTGTMFIDVATDGGLPDPPNAQTYGMNATLDCGEARTTTCGTMLEQDRHGYFNYDVDHDWYKLSLLQGRTYRIHLDAQGNECGVDIRVVDKNGKVALRPTRNVPTGPQVLDRQFTAAYSGTYFIDLFDVGAIAYTCGGDYYYSIKKIF